MALVDFVNDALAGLDPALVLRSDAVAMVEHLSALIAEETNRPVWLVVGPDAFALLAGEPGVIEPSAAFDDEQDRFIPPTGPAGFMRGLPLYLDPDLPQFGVAIP